MTRCLLTAATIGTLTGLALSFGPHGAIGVAVCAAGVLLWFGVQAARSNQRGRDKAYHPSLWVPEPDENYPGSAIVFDLKPWPIGDDERRP